MLLYKLYRLYSKIAAKRGRTKAERRIIRDRIMGRYYSKNYKRYEKFFKLAPAFGQNRACEMLQDETFPRSCLKGERILALLVPEGNFMSGGIYSIFSIAKQLRQMKAQHGYDVIIVTRPNARYSTYFRNTHFQNSENVYRFQQLTYCDHVKDIYLHIPEYAASTFLSDMTPDQRKWLSSREAVHINILNQNIRLMPTRTELEPLKGITSSISQSVAHHAYFSQAIADEFGIPTVLLPAYTDLTPYPPSSVDSKEKLIIYSLDEAPHKKQCLEILTAKLPDFKLVEIRDISFDEYMDLATRCLFSISFGEGFDGYVAQPIYQGGMGITVYNDDFFPSRAFKSFPNFFESNEDLLDNIVPLINRLMENKDEYEKLNSAIKSHYDELYSYEEYVSKISQVARREFDYYPGSTASIL